MKYFFVPLSLKTTRNNRKSPHGPIKKMFFQILISQKNIGNQKGDVTTQQWYTYMLLQRVVKLSFIYGFLPHTATIYRSIYYGSKLYPMAVYFLPEKSCWELAILSFIQLFKCFHKFKGNKALFLFETRLLLLSYSSCLIVYKYLKANK